MPAARLTTLLAAIYWTFAVTLAFQLGEMWRSVDGLQMTAYRNVEWAGPPAYKTLDVLLSNEVIGNPPFDEWPVYSIEWNGYLAVEDPGEYTFRTSTDDGSTVDLDGERVVDNSGFHREQAVTGVRRLEPGMHALRVRYMQNAGRSALYVLWAKGGGPFMPFPAASLVPDRTTLLAHRLRPLVPVAATALALAACLGLFLGLWPWLARVPGTTAGAAIGRAAVVLERPAVALAALVLVGGTARVLLRATMPAVIWPDSQLFYLTARQILEGYWAGHDPYRTLIYPYFLAALFSFGHSPVMGAVVIGLQQLMGLATMACLYVVGRRTLPPLVAAAGAALFGVHAMQLFYEVSVLTESLFTLVLAATIWLTVRACDAPTWGRAALVGVSTAALVLVRPVAQYYLVVVLAVGAVATLGRPWRMRLTALAVALICYGVPLAAWMAVNQREYGFFGVALGRGMGLYTRVFEIDRLVPPEPSSSPVVRELWGMATLMRWSPNRVRDELNYARGYSSARADEAMFGFAMETVWRHPVAFAAGSIRQWIVQIAEPNSGLHACAIAGGHVLCSGRYDEHPMGPFPPPPGGAPSRWRDAVASFILDWQIPIKPVAALALVGIVSSLASRRRNLTAALLAGTALYITAVPALTQVAQDRFRLPADGLIFLFAALGLAMLTGWAAGVARRWHDAPVDAA